MASVLASAEPAVACPLGALRSPTAADAGRRLVAEAIAGVSTAQVTEAIAGARRWVVSCCRCAARWDGIVVGVRGRACQQMRTCFDLTAVCAGPMQLTNRATPNLTWHGGSKSSLERRPASGRRPQLGIGLCR